MKKNILLLIVLMFVVYLQAANVAPATSQRDQPASVGRTAELHTSTAASKDTLDADEIQTYGPYQLCGSSSEPMYKGFFIQGEAISGTTPVVQFSYQLVDGLHISDTVSQWTAVCTLGTAATASYVDLSSLVGRGIVFRANNYDATESQISGDLRVIFKKDYTYNKNQ